MKAGYCHAFERAWQFPVFSAYVMPVVDESDGLASICGSCRCKTVSQGLPMVELEPFQCSLPLGSVSCHSGQCGVPTIAARCISHRSALRRASQCTAFPT